MILAVLLAAEVAAGGASRMARASTLLSQRRFFDAHVQCLIGRELSTTEDERAWFLIRDAYSLWMLGDRPAGIDALTAELPNLGAQRSTVAFAAAWLQLEGGNESPLAKFADEPSDLGKRAGLLLAIVHGRYQPGTDPALDPLVQSLEQRRTISPLAAGVLSAVLPGAGHARLGLWGDALLAFTLNGVAIGTTVEMARAHLVFPSIAAALISSLFYAGAIASASSLARESNERERSAALAAIETKLFPELPIAGGN